MSTQQPPLSPFGQQLRYWRRRRGLSQLALAIMAETTPRHMSFIETGRSRPGKELVLRLASCLDLSVRESNTLLTAAGLAPVYTERELSEEQMRPFRQAIEAMLTHHEPYPACAADMLGHILMANQTYHALWPGVPDWTPEESVDAFFAPGPMREWIENWAEVAWAYADARRYEAARSNNPRLLALLERILKHLEDVERPPVPEGQIGSPVVCPRFRMGDQVIRTFTTVVRFEHAHDVTLSELRVELIFPLDEQADAFFRSVLTNPSATLPE